MQLHKDDINMIATTHITCFSMTTYSTAASDDQIWAFFGFNHHPAFVYIIHGRINHWSPQKLLSEINILFNFFKCSMFKKPHKM